MRAFQYGKLFEPSSGLRIVERKARRCLAYCRHKLGLKKTPLPIPIEDWIERALDIRFGIEDLSHLGPQVLGAAFIKDREILISDKALQNEGRFRFTCAHELGHFVLHAKVADAFQETAEPGFASSQRIERNADRFAAAFLMPIPHLERELVRIAEDAKLDPQWCLSELMMPTQKSEDLWKVLVVPEVCRRFGVSRIAALIRARGLRLTTDLQRPLLPARFYYAWASPSGMSVFDRRLPPDERVAREPRNE